MSNTSKYNLSGKVAVFAIAILLLSAATAFGQRAQAKGPKAFAPTEPQQPLFSEYKGVRIGMTEQEVHAKLGQAVKTADADFYMFSDTETAQIAYDQTRKVVAISIDYSGGVGAPDYRTVVGNDLTTREDGSVYKMVHYDNLGFWVSYNRTGTNSTVMIVSITIQKIMK